MSIPPNPPRAGLPYTDDEIFQIYRAFRENPNPRSPTVLGPLARRLGRSEDAIDWIIRWMAGADFPRRAWNAIRRQVEAAKERYDRES